MHCNLKPPEPRQPFAALITTHMISLTSLNLSIAVLYRFCCWYITLRCELDPWPSDLLTLTFDLWPEHMQRIACDVMKPCTKFERNRAIRGGVIAISVFDLDLEHCVTCCARSWIIFTKFDLRQFIHAWIMAFLWCWYVESRCNFDLLPVDLKSSSYIKRHVIKVCTKFKRNRAIPGWIIDNFANVLHAVRLTLAFNFYSISTVMRLNSVQNVSEI